MLTRRSRYVVRSEPSGRGALKSAKHMGEVTWTLKSGAKGCVRNAALLVAELFLGMFDSLQQHILVGSSTCALLE